MTAPADLIDIAPEAQIDLDELLTFIADRDPRAARKLASEIDAAFVLLAAPTPHLEGAPVTLRSGVGCRRHLVHPVVIYWRRKPGMLYVLRGHHHACEPIGR